MFISQLKSVLSTERNIRHSVGMISVKEAGFDLGQRSRKNSADFVRILLEKERQQQR